MQRYFPLFLLVFGLWSCNDSSSESAHPPLFAKELAGTQVQIDGFMEQGIDVPTPKDMAGGYTHEVHKQNWKTLQGAAALYRHTGEERYAEFVRDVLLEYAAVYKSWPIHPTNRSYATGKVFWQCLNDANWLVYVSLAYNDIYDWLDEPTKATLNDELFRPMANFLSVENPQFFNRIHNHSTWANAAVGMIGLVMDDDALVQRALYGIPADELPDDLRDDDSGRIKSETGRAGFLAQLDLSFSPDGYFTEGPYYLRYALSPFLLFGKLLADKRPEVNVLEYRDGILGKAVYSMLSQADPTGDFFPLNDSQKGMSVYAPEVVKAVDYGYFYYGEDPELLSIAEQQGSVTLDAAGLAVASAIAAGKSQPFHPASVAYADGPEGTEGGVGVLRADGADGQTTTLVMKYSAQGMGHGHFDKLAYSFYNENGEVIQDYGAARWVNIDQKGGGRYLRENNTWAKQSIAHNTMVIGETSQYNGDIRIGEQHHPDRYAFVADDPNLQLISAKAANVYPGRELHRSQWLLTDPVFAQPLMIDVFRAKGTASAIHDLPTWYHGQLLQTNFPYTTNNKLAPLGNDHGYQHIWAEASARPDTNVLRVNFYNEGTFYTQSSVAEPGDEFLFLRLGANDPEFNLRRDQAFVHRRPAVNGTTFVSVLETHGSYDPREEVPREPYGHITDVRLLVDTDAYTAISFKHENGAEWHLLLANQNAAPDATHNLNVNGTPYQWSGVHHLIKND
jgi:hypothetical protein